MPTPSARSASSSGPQRAVAGVRVAVEGDRAVGQRRRPAAGTASPCRPGRRRRAPGPAAAAAGPPSARRRTVDTCAPIARRPAGHQLGVAGAQRRAAASTGRRPSALSTRARAVIDLEPGRRTRRRDRVGGGRGGPRHGGRVAVSRHVYSLPSACRSVATAVRAAPDCRDGRASVGGACAAGTRRPAERGRPERRCSTRSTTTPTAWSPTTTSRPTDPVPIVRVSRRPATGSLSSARWGLVPHWAPDTRGAARMINARAETVATTPAYARRSPRRRCLVPADGWYEWVRRPGGGKQAYYMTPPDGRCWPSAGSGRRGGPTKSAHVQHASPPRRSRRAGPGARPDAAGAAADAVGGLASPAADAGAICWRRPTTACLSRIGDPAGRAGRRQRPQRRAGS